MNESATAMLLQFSDSTLPVGSYAHSFGLEGLCQSGFLSDENDLRQFLLRDVSHSLLTVDLPLLERAYQATLEGDSAEVPSLDEVAWAMRPTRQLREAAGRIGRQTWLLYTKTWREEMTNINFSYFQAPVVSGVIFGEKRVPLESARWVCSYQTFSALVQSALKLLPIGPSAAQNLLSQSLQALDFSKIPKELGSFNPLWDIAASRHERADARLFIS